VKAPFTLCQATPPQAGVIRDLGDEAKLWLRGKDTDQWSTSWGGPQGRDKRIMRDITGGDAWILWDEEIGIATLSVGTEVPLAAPDTPVWPAGRLTEKALYVHRVIVRRSYAGHGIGAALLDWAAGFAWRTIGTPLLRIDVWTDNFALHDYYRVQGFTFIGVRDAKELPGYPSRALFELRTIPAPPNGLVTER
jgi:GNAT superfamily N-acetyltransferase